MGASSGEYELATSSWGAVTHWIIWYFESFDPSPAGALMLRHLWSPTSAEACSDKAQNLAGKIIAVYSAAKKYFRIFLFCWSLVKLPGRFGKRARWNLSTPVMCAVCTLKLHNRSEGPSKHPIRISLLVTNRLQATGKIRHGCKSPQQSTGAGEILFNKSSTLLSAPGRKPRTGTVMWTELSSGTVSAGTIGMERSLRTTSYPSQCSF